VTFCPTEELKQAAIEWGSGVAEEQFVVHGLPTRPAFWSPKEVSKVSVRNKLLLKPDLKSILLMAGGDGVGNIKAQANAIAKKLSGAPFHSQIVVICGHNKAMEADLKSDQQKWPANVKVVVLGFTTNVDEYMMASDILITKAGPGTICEAMILGVPLILSSFLPGQEEGNVPFVVNNGIGLYTEVPADMGRMCLELLSDEKRLAAMSSKAKAMSKPDATRLIAQDICRICFRERADFQIADLV
jgi:1,2-diacylglycerol 3-beta-galactosyltransferase